MKKYKAIILNIALNTGMIAFTPVDSNLDISGEPVIIYAEDILEIGETIFPSFAADIKLASILSNEIYFVRDGDINNNQLEYWDYDVITHTPMYIPLYPAINIKFKINQRSERNYYTTILELRN